ncbi:MAG: hypothetical protein QM650_01845 [Microlunatus sp.]
MQLRRGDFTETRSHWWWRPGWGPGSRFLTFHLTFEQAPELRAAASRFTDRTSAMENVDPVPPEWLHLTMTGVGFAGKVSEDRQAALSTAVFDGASTLDFEPLVFDSLFLSREGIMLAARRDLWLKELKALQECAVAEVCGSPQPGSEFHPHVSLAYFRGVVDTSAVVDAVGDISEITVAHPMLSLLELGRDDEVYTWRVVAQHGLRSGCPA